MQTLRERLITILPEPLRIAPRWILWKFVQREGEKKPAKVPVSLTGNNVDPTNPDNHNAFIDTVRAYEKRAGKVEGLGFALGDGWAGVDLDGCIDENGELHPAAARIIETFGTYAEISPSRTGVKLFGRADLGDLKGNRCKGLPWGGELEMYWCDRFFTVTGRHLPSAPLEIADIQEPFEKLHTRWLLKPEPTKQTATRATNGADNLSIQDLLAAAFQANNAAKITGLFNEAGHEGNSEGDAALAGCLAFYSGGDPALLEQLMRASSRVRPKWDERRGQVTWIADECRKAIERHSGDWYTLPRPKDPVTTTNATNADELAAAHGVTCEPAAEAPPAPKPDPLPEHATAARMAEYIGETEWLWPRWLPIGHISIMAAKRGVGKSALAIWLENCVATGNDWPDTPGLGVPGYALHVESESFQGGHRDRMQAWGCDMERILYLGKDGLGTIKLEDPKGLQAVARLVGHYGCKLVVIDALRRATNADENDSRLASILADWADMARDLKCALLLLHHMGKGYDGSRPPTIDDLRGTSGIADVARSALGLWTPDPARPGAVSVVQMKASLLSAADAEEARFSFEWDPAGGLDFDIPEPQKPRDETELDRAIDFVLSTIAANNGFCQRKDILTAAEAAGITRDRIDQAGKRLKDKGHITSKTVPGAGRCWVFVERHR